MSDQVILTGYGYSVYTRAARLALAEKGVGHGYCEVNPFEPKDCAALKALHPFGRVPVLEHGGFRLWETAAILGYVNEGFDGPHLGPGDAKGRARQRQVSAIIDNYGYWPLVRQVFSHGVFRPLAGEAADAAQVAEGLRAAPAVLDALEEIARDRRVLVPGAVCLAGCHLLPMLEYFVLYEAGREMVAARAALSGWLEWARAREAAARTRPDLAGLKEETGR
jgi:glutathione S-transferase